MKNYIKILIIICFILHTSYLTNAQTNLIISGGNWVNQNSNIVLNNTSFTNNGTFHAGSGMVIVTGDATTAQSELGGTSPTTFHNLRINKSTNDVILGQHATVNSLLLLTGGQVDISNYNLTIGNTGTISGGSTNNYIKTSNSGTLIQEVGATNVVFPVGKSTYTPVTLNNAGTTDGFNVRVENVVYDNGTSGNAITTDVVNATWHIDETIAGGSDITATFQWNASDELTAFDRTQAFVSAYHTSKWNNGAASAASGSNPYTLSESGISTFSPFILASDAAALPVELLYFYGENEGENVLLSWETATEINNDYFDVEYSLDGITFEKIGEVQGAGTTTENQSYEFLHDLNLTGFQNLSGLTKHYYRLRQVDFDGEFEYTNIVIIELEIEKISTINIFPNPTTDFINIEINENQIGAIAQIIDIRGQIVQAFRLEVTNNQQQVSSLPVGTYFVKIGKEIKKIIITK